MSTDSNMDRIDELPMPSDEQGDASPAPVIPGIDLADLERQARAFVQQRPVVAVLAAAGLGYLLARLASRTNR